MNFHAEENLLTVVIPSSLYSEEVIYKCFYWYTGDYSIEINSPNSATFIVSLQPKNEGLLDRPALINKVRTDLIDFKLRHIVSQETRSIRELIIAKAFAYADLEQNPETEVSDPVGFDPLLIH